jgi:hypothetical protein
MYPITKRSFSTSLYLWTRKLHLYFGLFLIPYILLFAISTLHFLHAGKSSPRVQKHAAAIQLADGVDPISQVPEILRQLNISGEVNVGRGSLRNDVLGFGVVRPGRRSVIRVDLKTKEAEVEEHVSGTFGAMRFLHAMPGPHKVGGVNWIIMKIWGVLADTTVYLILFLSTSGIYMWAVIKTERKAGLIALGMGVVSFVAILFSFFYA